MKDFSQFSPMDFSMWGGDPREAMARMMSGRHLSDEQPQEGAPAGAPPPPSGGMPPAGLLPSAGEPQPQPGGPRINIGGMDMPAPQAAPMPQVHGPKSRTSRLNDAIQGLLGGDPSAEYQGMLSPERIAGAKPSLLESLFSPSSNPSWRQRLDNLVKGDTLKAQVQAQAQVKAKRQQIFDMNPISRYAPNDEGRAAWAQKVIPGLMAIGDYDGVKELNAWVKGDNKGNVPKGELFTNPKSGEFKFFDPNKDTQIPIGWEPVKTTGGGTAALFVDKKGNFDSAHPDDTEKLKQLGQRGFMPVSTNNVVLKNEGMNDRFNKKQVTTLNASFKKDVNQYLVQVRAQNNAVRALETALHDPKASNRATTYGSAVSKYIQGADQPTNLREGLVKYYESKLDPSLRGRAEWAFSKFLKGELPSGADSIGEAMLEHIKDLRDVNYNAIETQRKEFLNNNPFLDESDLASTMSFFGGDVNYTGPSERNKKGGSGFGGNAPLIPGITPVRKP